MIVEYIIFAVCIGACGYQCYNAGIREGAAKAVDRLHEAKIIRYDHKGNIVPNEWFDA
tara:strand:+ start:357 stop:530 length:174 start_codon:yes stop_codon:yes gene_type:complete